MATHTLSSLQRFLSCFWTSQSLITAPTFLYHLGAAMVLSYALLKLSFPDIFDWLEPFALILVFLFFKYGGGHRHSFPVWLMYAAALAALVVWLCGMLNHPELIRQNPQLDHLLRHFVFVFLAIWLAGQVSNTLIFWLAVLVGLLLVPWAHGLGWADIMNGLSGFRIDFNLRNAQHTGMLYGAALIAILTLYYRLIFSGSFMWIRLSLWLICVIALVSGVLMAQTRAVFFAFAVTALCAGFLGIFSLISGRAQGTGLKGSAPRKLLVGTMFIAVSLIVSFQMGTLDTVMDRSSSQLKGALPLIFEAEQGVGAPNSISARILSWRAAWSWFVERPILGWGGNGGAIVMQNSPETRHAVFETFGHLHSSYVEMVIRYGLLGASIYVLLAGWTGWRAWQAWRAGVLPGDFFTFFCLFFVYWAVVNLFESYLFYGTGVYLFNVVMAALLGFIWRAQAMTADLAQAEKTG